MVSLDPLYGYGTGAASASSMYASDPVLAGVGDNALYGQMFFDNYRNGLESLEMQSSLLDGTYGEPGQIQAGSVDIAGLMQSIRQIDEEQMDYNMRQAEKYRLNGAQTNAPYNLMNFSAMALQSKIIENEQDQIPGALRDFIEAYRQACDPEGQMDEKTLLSSAAIEYHKITGKNLITDIRENGSSSFMAGFINSATFGLFGSRYSADDTIAQLDGQPVSSSSKNLKKAGRTAGGIVAGAGSGAALGAAIGTFGGPIGWGAGAIVGGIIGGLCGLFT